MDRRLPICMHDLGTIDDRSPPGRRRGGQFRDCRTQRNHKLDAINKFGEKIMIESETVRRTIEIREKKRQMKEEKGKERKKKKQRKMMKRPQSNGLLGQNVRALPH